MGPASQLPQITLLTDFGLVDHFVAVMKGVISRISPGVLITDISHQVEPYQIGQGAYLLSQSWRWFPEGTIHVAVVDPGVGSERRAIAASAAGHFFVLPDNGLLSLLDFPEKPVVRELWNEALFLKPVSRTFHGRDIFAPAAANLARGVPFADIGPAVEDWLLFPRDAGPSVLHIDRFGNVITSLRASETPLDGAIAWDLTLGNRTVLRYLSNYAAAQPGELFAIEGSGGFIEISARQASAAAETQCRVGDPVTLRWAGKS